MRPIRERLPVSNSVSCSVSPRIDGGENRERRIGRDQLLYAGEIAGADGFEKFLHAAGAKTSSALAISQAR